MNNAGHGRPDGHEAGRGDGCAVDSVFAAIGEALVKARKYGVAGVGLFRTRNQRARTGRNP